MRKKRLVIVIFIIFLISPIFIVFFSAQYNITLTQNESEEELIKNKITIPKSSDGSSWIRDGSEICIAEYDQFSPQIVSDGQGGAIITWYDQRFTSYYKIYVQKIDLYGNVQWSIDGIPVCPLVGSQIDPQICSDKAGGAIITWSDLRSGNWDIYAQRIDLNGNRMWDENGTVISTAKNNQYEAQICSDEVGGAIITVSYTHLTLPTTPYV